MSETKLATKDDLKEMYDRILPYLGGSADAGFTPVGTIIAVMGVSAPANYLACNGQTVNIADYPELANYFLQQFGSKNKFGGDGTTTFGIPDLRGEFLRGTGTNSHTISTGGETVSCGNGENVGTHQNPTLVPNFQTPSGGDMFLSGYKSTSMYPIGNNQESIIKAPDNTDKNKLWVSTTQSKDTYGGTIKYATRPTNTSVLYCIATKNIYLNPSNDYSTDEKVVGTWIDGKTLYQRTFIGTFGTITDETPSRIEIDISSLNIDVAFIVSAFLMASGSNISPLNDTYGDNGKYQLRTNLSKSTNLLYIFCNRSVFSNSDAYVTIQYTKTT